MDKIDDFFQSSVPNFHYRPALVDLHQIIQPELDKLSTFFFAFVK